MLFQNCIKRVFKALMIAFVVLISPAFATTHNITYELNGGSFSPNASDLYTYDDEATKILDIPMKEGYVFRGWYDSVGFSGEQIKTIPVGSTDDKKFYAKWGVFDPKFELTTTADIGDGDFFAFSIVAAGVFYVDWGDNSGIEVIDRTNNNQTDIDCNGSLYSHTYHNESARSYTIKLDGQATIPTGGMKFGGSAGSTTSVNEGRTNAYITRNKVARISGSLGVMFPVHWFGEYHNYMGPGYADVFANCINLEGTIPENLFKSDVIQSRVNYGLFSGAFTGCSKLTGPIPENLFSDYVKAYADFFSFYNTFSGCSNLGKDSIDGVSKYYIPDTLFAGVKSTADNYVMEDIFYGTGLLTECPANTNPASTGFDDYFGTRVSCVASDKVYCKYGMYFDGFENRCKTCGSGDTCPDHGAEYDCPSGLGGNSDSTRCITAYTINYELDGEAENSANPKIYTVESPTMILQAPTKAGYDFAGWYSDSNFATPVTEITTGNTGDVTLYAKWLQRYTVTYDLNGGKNNVNNPTNYNVESDITLQNPTKNYYTFVRWYDDNGSTVTTLAGGNSANITLHAEWTPTVYAINYYNMEGATSDNPSTYTYGSPEITLHDPVKSGYDFGGWYRNSYLSGYAVTTIPAGSHNDVNLYARWYQRYTIEYVLDGGTNNPDNPTSYTIVTPNITLKAPVKDGYDFAGWYLDSDFSTKSETITTYYGGDYKFYAKWLQQYPIHYELNGGTNNPENPTTYTVESPTVLLQAPTKDGFIFKGWYVDLVNGNKISYLSTDCNYYDCVDYSETLYAAWLPIYNLNYYDGMTGEEITGLDNPVQYYTNGSIYTRTSENAEWVKGDDNGYYASLNSPEKQGYIFEGWCVFDSQQAAEDNNYDCSVAIANGHKTLWYNISGDKYLYAKWTPIYNIEYYDGMTGDEITGLGNIVQYYTHGYDHNMYTRTSTDGEWIESGQNGTSYNAVSFGNSPSKNGYVFAGWCMFGSQADAENNNYDCNQVYYSIYNTDSGNKYLYAKWTPIYNIEYYDSMTGGEIVGLNNPVQYYSLNDYSSWYYRSVYTRTASDIAWPGSPTYYYYYDDIQLNQPAEKQGYKFVGWCMFDSQEDAQEADYHCSSPVTDPGAVSLYNGNNRFLYAQWAPVYDIEYYDSMTGEEITDMNNPVEQYYVYDYVYGKTADGNWNTSNNYLGTLSNKTDYAFAGWCVFKEEQSDPASAVEYNCQHPTVSSLSTGDYDSAINVSDGGDLYVYAKWTPIYDIHYNNMGADDSEELNGDEQYYIDYNDNSAHVLIGGSYMGSDLGEPTKTNSLFNGWCVFNQEQNDPAYAVENNCSDPIHYLDNTASGDKWVYAKWTPVNYIYYDTMGGFDDYGETNAVGQYYINNGDFRIKRSENSDYWDWGSYLGEPGKSGNVAFLGWCVFNQEQNDPAYAVENNCSDLRTYLDYDASGDKWVYAKWIPTYTIHYNNMDADDPKELNDVGQYYIDPYGNLRLKQSGSSWFQYDGFLGRPSKTGYGFVGWCVFNQEQNDSAYAVENNCSEPVENLNYDASGEKWIYAKWTPMNTYNLSYDFGDAYYQPYKPVAYGYAGGTYYTQYYGTWDYASNNSIYLGELPQGYQEFQGWYVCAEPKSGVSEAAQSSDCRGGVWQYIYVTDFSDIDMPRDLWLYAKFGSSCQSGEYDAGGYCEPCPENYFCPGDGQTYSCPDRRPFSSLWSSSDDECQECPIVDYDKFDEAVTLPRGYYVDFMSPMWKGVGDPKEKDPGKCVTPALFYNEAVEACYEDPENCDQTELAKMGVFTCRYNQESDAYTDCSSVASVCDMNGVMELMEIFDSGDDGKKGDDKDEMLEMSNMILDFELSRKGLNQSMIDWNSYCNKNDLTSWTKRTDVAKDVAIDKTYCNVTETQECVAGQAAEFKVYSSGTVETSCISCPAGSYCPDSNTYSFSDSVFVSSGAQYDTYLAGMIACPGGAVSDEGASSVGACNTQTCMPDHDGNGNIISGRVPGGNILTNAKLNGATKTPEVVTFLDDKYEPYQTCATVYVSVLDEDAFAKSQLATPQATLADAGLRGVICKYNTANGKYDLCTPAFTICNSMYWGMFQNLGPSDTVAALMQIMMDDGDDGKKGDSGKKGGDEEDEELLYIPDEVLARTLNIDSLESMNPCSCDEGLEWNDNICCPEGSVCCLPGTKFYEKGWCEPCSGASCPAEYTRYIDCPGGYYANPDSTKYGTDDQCLVCPAGYYCPGDGIAWDGVSQLTDETAGKFKCKSGTYNNETESAYCKTCPDGATSSADGTYCICPKGTNYDPAGVQRTTINGVSTVKDPEFVNLIQGWDGGLEPACVNVYTSIVDMDAFNEWKDDGMSSNSKLAEAGLRLVACKYDEKEEKYSLCADKALTLCSANDLQQISATTDQILGTMAQKLYGLKDNMLYNWAFDDVDLSDVFGINAIYTGNYCPDEGVSCAEGYYWEEGEKHYNGNNCCPNGYACCLAGSKYDPEEGICMGCYDSDPKEYSEWFESCPTTYAETLACPEGTYIDQSAIGTDKQCATCPLGHYCPGVSVAWKQSLTDNEAGKYECPDGSYADETGLSACTVCGGGMSTGGTGATSDSACSTTTCVDGVKYNPAGTTFVSGATKQSSLITLVDTKKGATYQECAKAYISVLDNTVFANGMANATADELSKSGMRLVICRFDDKENKYTNCSYAIPACDGTYQYMMMNYTTDQIAGAVASNFNIPGIPDYIFDEDASGALGIDGVRNFYGSAEDGAPTCAASCPTGSGYYWESHTETDKENNEKTIYTGNTCCPDDYACCLAGYEYDSKEERCVECSGDNCPTTYTKRVIACPESNGTNSGQGVIELDMGMESPYGDTMDKCIELRLYYEDPTPLAGGLNNVTVDDLIDAGASVAFCRYNTSTGNYDGNCTPKYSLCSNDDLETLFSGGTTIGVLQNMLNLDSPDDISDSLFAKTSASLASESVTNRCTVSCPDASDFSNMSLSGAGMMQMGNGMEASYGQTSDDCVSMRVYYNDGSVLFDGNGPSMDIDDWVDAGASVAFCKYNTGSSETDLCTPKYSMCSDDNLMTLMAAGNAVGIMQTLLGVDNASALGTYFTQAPESLVAATATNRCEVEATCESGHVCCAEGTYINPDTTTHGTENQCLACPAGYYCPGDDWDTTTGLSTNKTACGAGTYNDQENQISSNACLPCSDVNYATGSSEGAAECGCSVGYHWDSLTHTCAANIVSISWAGVADPGEAATCIYGGNYTPPSAPDTVPEGYRFIGWRILPSGSNNNNDNSVSQEQ